ncbi:T9SS type B sorting domain-containing protein [Flavobacterium rivuli]|nr:T9SS type B sorting domain-containing protein [Flavobacterium rivuli]
MLLFFLFFFSQIINAQIYQHNFGTTTIPAASPYTVVPNIIDSNLSGSSWTNSVGSWTSGAGATGQAIMVNTPANVPTTLTLTFNVAPEFAANITSFNFWRQRSNSGPANWSMTINGINVGNGATNTSGSAVGNTNVAGLTSLTGTITVVITVSNGNGGWFRLDNFTLNGTVVSNCAAAVFGSISPTTGPVNTLVKITGSNFTGATSVRFDGVQAVYTVVSDTEIQARIPVGTTVGAIGITSAAGCTGLGAPTGTFTLINSQCGAPEIFISEVYDQRDQSGGMIELYNPSNARITFNGLYRMIRYGNIADNTPTAGYDLTLPGFIEPHATYLIPCSVPLQRICAAPTTNVPSLGSGFNGNDKLELLKNNIVIDRVEVPFTLAGFTLIRNPNVTAPTATYNGSEWTNTQHDQDANAPLPDNYCANLGFHTINTTVPTQTHPQDLTVCEGSTATFTATVDGTATYTYQWKVLNTTGNWVNVVNGTNYQGAGTDTLTINNVPQSFTENQYYCHITSTSCDINSNAAQLKISPLDPVVATVSPTDCITNTATVTVSAPAMASGITFAIDGGTPQASNVFAGTGPGLHNIVVTSGNCTVNGTATVIAATPLAAVTTTVSATSCATNTATITINTPAMGAGITYAIDGGTPQASNIFTAAPGLHNITVSNGNCIVTGTATVSAAPALAAVDATVSPTDCSTGLATITVNAPVGTGIVYTLDGNPFNSNVFPASPGLHTLRAVNGNCSSETQVTVGPVPVLDIVNVQISPTDCTTGLGTVTVIAPVGNGITYTIGGVTHNTTVFTVPVGNYTLRAVNGNCASEGTVRILPTTILGPVTTTVSATACATNTATITINTPAMAAGITYALDGGTPQASNIFTAAPGPHTIVATNGGCTSNGTATVGAAGGLAAVTTTVSATACATNTATITVNTPSGAGITFAIDGGTPQASNIFTAAPGSHTITAVNGSCSSNGTATVGAAPPLAAVTSTVTSTDCATNTATITVNTPAMGAGITFAIDGGTPQASNIFTAAPGSHTIDAVNGSCSSNGTVTVAPASGLAAVTTTVSATACATNTATITVNTPAMGTGITFAINGGTPQASNTFTAAPGPHTITAVNGSCTSNGTATVGAAPPLAAVTTTVSATACATNTATITVNTPSGAGITFAIDGGTPQASNIFTAAPGPHTITAVNGSCTSNGTATVGAAPPLAAITTTVSATACATNTATITVNTPSGAGITFAIDGGTPQASNIFTAAPGSHTITAVTGSCSSSGTLTVAQPPALAAVTTTISTTDCTTNTATITVNTPSGAGITFAIDGGTPQASNIFTAAPGSHTITAVEGSCNASGTITVAPASGLAAVTTTVTTTDCTTNTATITVNTPAMGTGITFAIDGGTPQASNTFNAAPGRHTIVAVLGSCTTTNSVTVGAAPPLPAITTTISSTDCVARTATITITSPSGGGITYTLDGVLQTSNIFTASVGQHTIMAVNGSCTSSVIINITPAPLLPRPVIAVTQPTCPTMQGGFRITSPTGGYTYQVNGGAFTSTTDYSALPPATYTVVAKDANGCLSQSVTFQLTAPVLPAVPVADIIAATCQNAFASIVVDSPRAPGYTYSIDGGATWQSSVTFGGLLQGTYTIIVRTSAMCTAQSIQYTINAAPQVPATPVAQLTPPDCAGNLGSLEIIPQPGTGFTYSLNGGAFTTDLIYSNLPSAQSYYVTVKNSDGCTARSITYRMIASPVRPIAAVTALTQPDCTTDKGTILITAPLGPQYTYSIDGVTFQSSRLFTNLNPANYTVTVSNGQCTSTAIVTINNPPAPAPSPGTITGNDMVCIDDALQLANTVTGGVWGSSNTGIATVDANGLVTPKRTGSVTITYTVGTICTADTQKTITINAMPRPVLQDIYYVCKDAATGVNTSITLHSGLAVTTYSFAWTKDGTALTATSSYLNTNETGEYTVTATNILSGCSTTVSTTVKESSIASATAVVGVDFNFNQVITVTVTGGSGDYEYSLDGGRFQDEPYFTKIDEGEHEIRVKDKNNCGTLILHVFSLNYPRFFSPNGDGVGDTWNIKGLQNQRDAVIYIYDRFGKLIAGIRPSGAGWDGTLNGHPLPATDYWFTVSYLSSNGVQSEFKAHFSLLR